MKVLLIGKNGQLGWELCRTDATNIDLVPMDYPEFDLADQKKITGMVNEIRPDCVINAAAYTAVDKAEFESEQAKAINVEGVSVLARAISKMNSRLIHIPTDFVFDGRQGWGRTNLIPHVLP